MMKAIGTINYTEILKEIVNDLDRLEELEKENQKLKEIIKLLISYMNPPLDEYKFDNKEEAYVFNDLVEGWLAYYQISKESYDLLKELENDK